MIELAIIILTGLLLSESLFWSFTINRHGIWLKDFPDYERVLAVNSYIISFSAIMTGGLSVISWGWMCHILTLKHLYREPIVYNDYILAVIVGGTQLGFINLWMIVARYYCLPKIFWPLMSASAQNLLVKYTVMTDMAPYCLLFSQWRVYDNSAAKQKSLLVNFLDIIPDMVWTKDMDNKFTYANKAICERLMMTEEHNIIGKTSLEIALALRAKGTVYTFGEICADSDFMIHKYEKAQQFLEYGLVDNRFMALQVLKSPIYRTMSTGNRVMVGTIGIGRDVTTEWEDHESILMHWKAGDFDTALRLFEEHKNRHLVKNNAPTK